MTLNNTNIARNGLSCQIIFFVFGIPSFYIVKWHFDLEDDLKSPQYFRNNFYATHTHQKEVLHLIPALVIERSYIKIMVNKWRRPSCIYGKFVSYHQLDFRGFFICFFCWFWTVWCFIFWFIQWILLDLIIFVIQINLVNKKSVLAFKNMFPAIYFCRLFICYVDTHVEMHTIKINPVAICTGSKFNLTGLIWCTCHSHVIAWYRSLKKS